MRILIVEDEKETRESLKSNLEQESFAVDTAEDGETGSYLARTNDYDLIILDNILPQKEGFEVCEDVRKAGKHTPIIMLSVKSEVHHKVDLLHCGADDYVTKPFSFRELIARIRAILRRPRMVDGDILSVGDLTMDIARQVVQRGGKNIYLTRKEFMLLEYLMRNRARVMSRGMIMEHVWNADSDPFSNTIEAHILNLRKKVDANHKVKLIHSVSGRGYKIDVEK